mgnify:FL=1
MKKYTLAHNTIDNHDYNHMIDFLKRRKKLTQSKVTQTFEKKFSNYLGSKYSIFVNSGSSANLLIAQSLLEGDYLKNKIAILPAVSWSTTVSPFLQLGYKVILCDCDKANLGLDINHLKKLCSKYKPGLVVLVNVLGHSNDYQKILRLKNRFNFEIMEDNCESMGSSIKKKKLGTFGIASSHSLYYGHHISTIEGGLVSTNDRNLYNIFMAIRSHGWARDMEKNQKKFLERKYKIDEFKSLYTFYYSGFNIRSSDFNANLGIHQLKKIKNITKIRFKNFKAYKKNLKNFWSQKSKLDSVSSFGYATFVANRLEVYKYLQSKKIDSRPLICGNMGQQPFLKKVIKSQKLINANFVDKFGLYLPNHASLNIKDINYISACFSQIAKPKDFK